MNRLVRLYEDFGQSPWLDNLKRGFITSGALASVRDRGVRGLTSNPTIFQKAIQGSPEYDDQFRGLVAAGTSTIITGMNITRMIMGTVMRGTIMKAMPAMRAIPAGWTGGRPWSSGCWRWRRASCPVPGRS